MMEIKNLVRKNIRDLQPYSSARSLFSGEDAILLDANENANDLFGGHLNRYPDPLQTALKKSISKVKRVPSKNIFLGNGSDEAIDLLLRIFCEPGKDEIIICPPTYGMYKVQANIHGALVTEVLLDEDFDLRPDEILDVVKPNSKLLFLCSPNSPTGNLLDTNRIGYLINNFPGIVVVDEAYIDYAEKESWSYYINEYPNLVVLQTFSKAFALAGVRLGMAFASEEIMYYFNSIKFPYNINVLTQQRVLDILKDQIIVDDQFYVNIKEKNRLELELIQLDIVERIYPSDANFLLVKMKHSDIIFQALKAKRIIIRDRSKEPMCGDCLRITIGTKQENDLLIQAIKEVETASKA